MSKLLVIDTETTGLDPSRNNILSLGAVVWNDGVLGEEFEVYILESNLEIDQAAMKINRIDLDWLSKYGNSPFAAINEYFHFLNRNFRELEATGEKIVLVGHNINFDVDFVKRLFRIADHNYSELFSHRVLDTAGILRFLALAGRIPMEITNSSRAFDYFQIDIDPGARHSALADARATGMLLTRLVALVQQFSITK